MTSSSSADTNDFLNTFRVACLGVKIRYNGTMLNRVGMAYACVSPSHSDVTYYTLSQIQSSPHFVKFDFQNPENSELCLSMSAIHKHEQQLQNYGFNSGFPYRVNPYDNQTPYYDYAANGAALSGPACGIVYIAAPSGTTFDVELIQFFEYAGPAPGLTATPSPNHDDYMPLAHRAIDHARYRQSQQPNADVVDIVTESIGTHMGTALLTMGEEQMAADPFGGALAMGAGAILSNHSVEHAIGHGVSSGISAISSFLFPGHRHHKR
jgi:hypothetical protein